jgi:Transposase
MPAQSNKLRNQNTRVRRLQDVCRKHGISDVTFYTWKSKYSGPEVSEARRLNSPQEENRRLKKLLGGRARERMTPALRRLVGSG